MAAPEGQRNVRPFAPPSWMLNKARENVSKAGLAPGALSRKLSELRTIANADERKTGTARAFAKKAAEVKARNILSRAPQSVGNPEIVEQQSKGSLHPHPPEDTTTTTTPKDAEELREIRRKLQHQERREKKKATRMKQGQGNKKSSSTPETVVHPSIAESSASGTVQETAATDSGAALSIPTYSKVIYHTRPTLPKWLTSIPESSFALKELGKKRPQDLTALEALKNCIRRCEVERRPAQLNKLYEELRDHVHKAEIRLNVNKYILKKAKILNPENGLPRIFKEAADFPPDLKADSYQLYNRWYREDFEQDILHGLITKKAKDRNGDSIDPAYRKKHPASAKYYGEGDLVLGQWWPFQICTVRDGVHGAAQGGIFGERDKGAYSIVLSGGSGYNDTDHGTTIDYSGTEGSKFTPTENTNYLIKSLTLQNDIRVIRSCHLDKANAFRPELGLRYDGLYRVKGYTLVDKEKAMYRFRLGRCEGQEPIRCEEADGV